MNIVVTGKNMQVGESLTQRIEIEIDQLLQKYFSGRGEANVILTKEASGFQCDIKIHLASGVILHADTHNHNDATYVFTQTEEKIAKQLRRYKRRLNDIERGERPMFETTEYILKPSEIAENEEDQPEETHLIIAEEIQSIERLTVSDAVMRLDFSNLHYLLFKNVGNNRVNLVYRRPDGHYGWLNLEQQ